MNWTIYALKHPRTGAIRYVGWTAKSAAARLRAHIKDALASGRTHRHTWIRSLLGIGLSPVIEVLETGAGDGWADAEKRWISFFRENGAKLVNATEGGDGVIGLTPEQMSARAKKGHGKKTPEQRKAGIEKVNAALSVEVRRAAGKKGQASRTPEQRREAGVHAATSTTTHEQRSAAIKKQRAQQSTEQRSAIARHAATVNTTPEQRSARGRYARQVGLAEAGKK